MFDGKDISCPQLEELYNQYDGLLSYDGGDVYKCELTDELIKEVGKWDDFPNVGFNKSYFDIEELDNADYIKNISNGKFKVVNYSDGGSQIYGNSFCLCLIDFDSNLLYYIRHWQ